MIKRNIKIIAALAIVASIGTGVITTHAASLSKGTTKAAYYANRNFKKGTGENFSKTKLDALVTAGTITADQETAVLNLFTSSSTDTTKTEKKDVKNSLKTKLDTLVTAGTITQEQETAIQNLFTHDKNKDAQAGKEKFTNSLKTKLDTLVTSGTITQAQEDAMITSLTSLPNKTSQN